MTFTAGYELTFTNTSLIAAGAARGELDDDTRDNIAACARFANEVRASIGDHAYSVEDDGYGFPRYVFTYPDGYWIKIEIDPWVVIRTLPLGWSTSSRSLHTSALHRTNGSAGAISISVGRALAPIRWRCETSSSTTATIPSSRSASSVATR